MERAARQKELMDENSSKDSYDTQYTDFPWRYVAYSMCYLSGNYSSFSFPTANCFHGMLSTELSQRKMCSLYSSHMAALFEKELI